MHLPSLDPYDGEYSTKYVPWFSPLHTWINQLLFAQVFPQPGLTVGVDRRIVRQSKNPPKSPSLAFISEVNERHVNMVLVWCARKASLRVPVLTLARSLVTHKDASLSVLEVRGCGEQNTR